MNPESSDRVAEQVRRAGLPEAGDDPWEEAYCRFETPEQEVAKFRRRLVKLGAGDWPRDAEIVELFCGRGNGLHALNRLGFTRVEGVDISASLLERYHGPAACYVGDCRRLQFPDSSRDIIIIQGGLHHLSKLPDDLDRTLDEVHRVLRQDGLVMIVEPWQTFFLTFVHAICRRRIARQLWSRIDALATMTEYELTTYEAWLKRPGEILDLIERRFTPIQRSIALGKLMFLGRKRGSN